MYIILHMQKNLSQTFFMAIVSNVTYVLYQECMIFPCWSTGIAHTMMTSLSPMELIGWLLERRDWNLPLYASNTRSYIHNCIYVWSRVH